MKTMLGERAALGCAAGCCCACASRIGAPAPSVDTAASMVPPSNMLRRSSARSVDWISGLVSSRSFSVFTTCSSILPYRLQLVLNSFRAGFGGGIVCAVAWRLVIWLAARKVGKLLHPGLVSDDEGRDFLPQPRGLADDVSTFLGVG